MSYGASSAEIAEDYLHSLRELSLNSRYEISNLTIIAKENTEHALAISEALKTHIKQVAPPKKLPAFYVLDSVVKNVGTPYTLFFGRQLYSTFMEAYALVDNNTRSKMVEMLKTWKEPVPGSMDPRPVFPPEVTRPIENALIKARTSFLQAHQENTRTQQAVGRGRSGPSPTPYRETPTPPNTYRQPPPPQPQGYQAPGHQAPIYQTPGYQAPGYPPQGQQISGQQPGYPPNYPQQQYNQPVSGQQYTLPVNGQQYSQPNGQQPYGLPPRPPSEQYTQPQPANPGYWQQQQTPSQGYGSAEDGIGQLNNDIEKLITSARAEWPQNPHDTSIGTKLKALLDLQTILKSQQLPPDQISLIKEQVAQLSRPSQPAPHIQSPPMPSPTPAAAPQPLAQQPTLSSILGPAALAALSAMQSQTPPTQAASIRSPPQAQVQPAYQPLHSTAPTPAPAESNSLLERLRAAGILGSTPTPNPPPVFNPPRGFPPGFPPTFLNTPPSNARTPLAAIPNDVVLKAASLKIPRPHLISGLYEGLGAPCTQCGRRFQSDEIGRKKKAAHMDWHFHVRQRMDEAESRGQHRSWYVDELDWIKSREVEGESGAISSEPSLGINNAATAAATKLQYLAVPDDPALANSVCPICQEKFEMKWLDEAQEFVWMDAKKVGERIFHASCYAEAAKDVTTQIKRGTPEPVLGKRKAEDDQMAFRAKIKSEPGV